VAHKARAGGVKLGLETAAAVEATFDHLIGVAHDAAGVLIQQMVSDAQAEIIVGMSRDPQFGAVIACGLGGVFVETLRDVQLLLPPVSAAEARAALSRLRGAALLERADIEAVIDVLERFSELCLDLDDVFTEIDLNPLIVRSTGQGAVAVDSLFVLDQ
jgi:acyl-CoA synthetase (NDP forming)